MAATQVTLDLLTQQTAAAQGTFARETDSAAGSAQIAQANWENAAAALGEALLPFMTEGAKIAAELATWLQENDEVAVILAVTLGVLAAAVLVLTAAQWAYNIALLANPIGLVIAAIVLGIAAIIVVTLLIIQNWETIEQVAVDVWNTITGAIQTAWEWLVNLFTMGIPGWLSDVMGWSDAGATVTFAAAPAAVGFTSAEAAEAFAYRSAPADAMAVSAAWSGASVGASRPELPAPGDTYNVTVNGAVDPYSTARQVRGLLAKESRMTGARAVGASGGWLGR
jgi:hypothetical protein